MTDCNGITACIEKYGSKKRERDYEVETMSGHLRGVAENGENRHRREMSMRHPPNALKRQIKYVGLFERA